ncbi:MAG: GGDEF domain-containing protein, partial [Phycisphaerales bacterium]
YELTDQIDESWRQLLLDPITRVWNHEGTMTLIGEAVSNVQSSPKGISLIMIESKGLETIRDHLGVEAYEEALKSFSAGLLSIVRENDTLGRIQDHEFVIELAGTDNRKDLRVAIGRINAYLAKYMPHAEITVQLEECGVDWSLDASIAAVLVPAGTTLNANTAMEILDDAIDQAERCPDGIPVILDAQEQIDKATDTDTNRAA